MSEWARKRRKKLLIIIGVVILAFIILIVYRTVNKPPTCFDGEMNGGEIGVDCGGTCDLMCTENLRDLVVWWERPFEVTDGVYNVVAYFENQNLEAGLEELTYEFRVYNQENILVSEPIIGTTFIEPNKRSAIFESGIQTGGQEAFTVFFRVSSNQRWEKVDESFAYSLFQVGEPILTNQEVAPKLQASIKNTSLKNLEDIPVIVIVYNREDNAIAASRTYIDEIPQGSEENAYFSWPEPFSDEVARIEIIPRVNPFNTER